MVKAKVREVAKLLKKSFENEGVIVEKIVIFGSQVKGTQREDSDIDIIVVADDFKGKNIFQRAKITGSAHREVVKQLMLPLDIISMSPEEWRKGTSLITNYAKEGKVIYGMK